MFGNDYFEIRQRLKNVVAGVLALADKVGAEHGPLVDSSVKKGLNDAILFSICGEGQVGKSALLNALFCCEFDGCGKPFSEDAVRWHLYGKGDEDKSSLFQHVYRIDELFKKYHIADTPGINGASQESKLATQSVLSISDVIFWVFSVENPWSASTWDMLSKQKQETLDRSMIVLQQADLRQPQDIQVILGHMNDLAQQRIGQTLPTFPVSALSAQEAKCEERVDRRALDRSGFLALEHHISLSIEQLADRKHMLERVRDAVVKVLYEIESSIEHRSKLLDVNEGFLREIELEVVAARESHSAEFQANLEGMRKVFEGQIPGAMMFMKSKMSVISSLKSMFLSGHFSKKIEIGLIELIQSAVEKQTKRDGVKLVADCKVHWKTVQPRVYEQLTIKLDSFDEVSGGFVDIREKFTDRMGAAAVDSILKLRIRSGLDRLLSERLELLKLPLYVTLVCLSLAGITGFLQIAPYPYLSILFLLCAMASMVFFSVKSNRSRKDIMRIFRERLEDARIPFADGLTSDYKEGVHDFYVAYGGLLSNVRTHIVKAQQELQPNMEQWNGLFLDLKGIEQDF